VSPQDPSADTVTITRAEYDQLAVDAGAWRMLRDSEHILDLLAEWLEWDRRRTTRQISGAFSEGMDWTLQAGAPTYAELKARRQLTTETPCGSCGATVTLTHPLPDEYADRVPDLSWARCDTCAPVTADRWTAA
jgi:hypothetical protein